MTTTDTPKPVTFHRVFRFHLRVLELSDEKARNINIGEAHWEGPHLVFTRGLQADPDRPSLYEELCEVTAIEVHLLTARDETAIVWRLTFEKVTDRGFLWMNAAKDEVAQEAVCLLYCHAVEVHTAPKAATP